MTHYPEKLEAVFLESRANIAGEFRRIVRVPLDKNGMPMPEEGEKVAKINVKGWHSLPDDYDLD